jgi:SagB-type dehydrogenase family enzyme
MSKSETDAARRYHEATKHSYESVRRGARGLDWANKPDPYKEYPGIELEPLPPELERLLRLGAGVVRRRRGYEFRTYSSAGALYPIEVYVATADGLFHFHPRELGLRRLRGEDVRDALGGGDVVLCLTGILRRTAWKYEARGYRHLFWDAGTMLANLLELAPGEARVVTGFVDDEVNALLGVDGEDEAALALLRLG